jgi:polyphosphate glucokinase
MIEAIHPEDAVIGGGNAKKLSRLPPGCRLGANAYAFVGGFRLWGRAQQGGRSTTTTRPSIIGGVESLLVNGVS